jgi:hypothetical protein
VKQLLARAEEADATPLQEGLSVPEEITRRQERKAALEKARAAIEARAHARYAAELAQQQSKLAERQARRERGEKPGGRAPAPPRPEPAPKEQDNFTDPESRIMKTSDGFQQCYNAQAAVEVHSRLIVGERVSQSPNDKEELAPSVAAIASQTGPLAAVLADSGFYSEAAVKSIEQKQDGSPTGTVVYTAMERSSHHRSVAELENKPEPPAPPPEAGMGQRMRHRLKTPAGQALYKLRQQTVEPVFGIIKSAMGFRQFLLRGMEKVSTEWKLVCLAHNLRRLHTLTIAAKLAAAA